MLGPTSKGLVFLLLILGANFQGAVAQTPPSLTPTLPLPNNPILQTPAQPIPAQAVCTEQYAPVCGRIGGVDKTYSNQCFARVAGAQIISQGSCANSSGSARPN